MGLVRAFTTQAFCTMPQTFLEVRITPPLLFVSYKKSGNYGGLFLKTEESYGCREMLK